MAPGGYYNTSGSDPSIKLRLKEDYDGAEPAPSSVAVANLIRLAALLPGASTSPASAAGDTGDGAGDTGDGGGYLATADKTLQSVRGKLQGKASLAAPQMAASAWLRSRVPLRQVRGVSLGDWVNQGTGDGMRDGWAVIIISII